MGAVSAAYANFGVHGGYAFDTDSCAGCHRAHTAPSPLNAVGRDGTIMGSALLLSLAQDMNVFCLTCHGFNMAGSATDVEFGQLDNVPAYSFSIGTTYAPLNGGGFGVRTWVSSTLAGKIRWWSVETTLSGTDYETYWTLTVATATSAHNMDATSTEGTVTIDGNTFPVNGSLGFEPSSITAGTNTYNPPYLAWGGGFDNNWQGPGRTVGNSAAGRTFTCTNCHDPHGDSNYRILKAYINSYKVGGYLGDFATAGNDPTPDPYVISIETSFPTEGFRLHRAATQYGYQPNYTEPFYAKAPSGTVAWGSAKRGISWWCSACHDQYMAWAGGFTGQGTDTDGYIRPGVTSMLSSTLTYNAADGYGFQIRHRHRVGVTASSPNLVRDTRILPTVGVGTGSYPLPLEHDWTVETTPGKASYSSTDNIGCLTCHRAHGSAATMAGYANVTNSTNPQPDTGYMGVDPTQDSALLRLGNRSVCEECHNK